MKNNSKWRKRGNLERRIKHLHCEWCGNRLPHQTEPYSKKDGGYGYAGNGYFCSLRCGFQYAIGEYGRSIT
ncbi:hypothetical protein [uncultured Mediterranean phage uvDeep-CGR0-AD1-C239]|nr:hypothetical protein [uncultured Mediterranean phage uvDeep-CGR0-AD1-C239]